MVLAKSSIQSMLALRSLIVDPLNENSLQPASIDLCLGNRIGKYSTLGELDSRRDSPTINLMEILPHGILIRAGESVLASTKESVRIPNTCCGIIAARSTMARMFVSVCVMAEFIDPGFTGTLDLHISNLGANSVRLYAGDRIAQLVLFQLSASAEPYSGKYQGKQGVTPYVPDKVK